MINSHHTSFARFGYTFVLLRVILHTQLDVFGRISALEESQYYQNDRQSLSHDAQRHLKGLEEKRSNGIQNHRPVSGFS